LLAKELVKQGNNVSYIAESLSGNGNRIEIIDDVTLHWVPYRKHFDILNILKYYSKLKQITPEIIIQRYTSLYTGVNRSLFKSDRNEIYVDMHRQPCPTQRSFCKKSKANTGRKIKTLLQESDSNSLCILRDTFRNYGMKFVTYPCIQNSTQYNLLLKHYGLKGIYFPSGHEVPLGTPKKGLFHLLFYGLLIWTR